MRLFLDANVLFTAAHNPNGKAALTIELGKRGHWALATSLYASEEARRNLVRKFPRSLDGLNALLRDIPLVEPRPGLPFPAALGNVDAERLDGHCAAHGSAITPAIGTSSTPAIIDTRQLTVGEPPWKHHVPCPSSV